MIASYFQKTVPWSSVDCLSYFLKANPRADVTQQGLLWIRTEWVTCFRGEAEGRYETTRFYTHVRANYTVSDINCSMYVNVIFLSEIRSDEAG